MANERNFHDKNMKTMKPDFSIYMYIQILMNLVIPDAFVLFAQRQAST